MDKHQEILSDTEPVAEDCDDTDIPSPPSVIQPRTHQPSNKALFLLKLKEERRISQTNVDFLVNDITVLVQEEIRSLQKEIVSCIRQGHNADDSD